MAPAKMRDRTGRVLSRGMAVRVISDISSVQAHMEDVMETPLAWDTPLAKELGKVGTVRQLDSKDRTAKILFTESQKEWWFPIATVEPPEGNSSLNDIADLSVLQLVDRLWEDHSTKDVTFKVTDGEVQAHKCVLAAASPVLSSMFSGPMLESRTASVELPQVDQVTMRVFLRLLYTGAIDIRDWAGSARDRSKEADELPLVLLLGVLRVAKKYLADSVTKLVVEVLKTRLAQASGIPETVETILAASIAEDIGALRMASIQVAKQSEAMRERYETGELRPEVEAELQALWPPRRPQLKRARLR